MHLFTMRLLRELQVEHVKLASNLNPDNDEAPTAEYVAQLYQGGDGIDISTVSSGGREVSIRTDASLAIDGNNNLSVNPSAFVNNQSIRVSSDGKLTSGLLFQSMNSLGLRNNNEVYLDLHTQGNLEFDGEILTDVRTFGSGLHENSSHEVSLDLTVEGGLEMNASKTNVRETLTASNGIARVGNDFRGAYVAGNNISISGATISCTKPDEQPYVGGNGITVAGKTISNTFSLTAGTGIILVGSPGVGYTISTIDTFQQKKAADEPIQQRNEGSAEEVFKSGSGDIISISGGLTGVLGGLGGLFGAGSMVGTASSAIGAVGGGLLSGVSGGFGGFITIFGRERKRKEDVNGSPIIDAIGNYEVQSGSNVTIVTLPNSNGCDTTRLMFDTPPACNYLGITNEYPQQAVNLEMLRQYNTEDAVDLNTGLITGIEEDLFNNYQPKITNVNKIPYSNISGIPDLSPFLTRTTDLNAINASIAAKQNIISTTNRLDYSLLSNAPNLALKQDLITSSAKLPYSLISGAPDFSPYLTRTTDLSSINASIAAKVSQSAYDTRQTVLITFRLPS
ncbi:hypothetical protein DFS34DRAFT_468243 [Phlyctochytrium arcticum]|nr:hypothetical protein DFS34DRAFT_468243 [Phlyctochytrium arcticum]